VSEIPDRLTVVETIYHHSAEDNPTQFECRFCRHLKAKEQPYSRKCKATEEWQALDTGWVERIGMIQVINEEGRRWDVNPTEEEKAAVAERVIKLRSGSGIWDIPPGESFRGCPAAGSLPMVRCQEGVAKFTVNVISR